MRVSSISGCPAEIITYFSTKSVVRFVLVKIMIGYLFVDRFDVILPWILVYLIEASQCIPDNGLVIDTGLSETEVQ